MSMTKKILIVDDEQTIREGLSKALCQFCDFHGEIKTVENGKDAIEEISRCFYDVCFLDMRLPDSNGIDVMKKINELSPETKIAVMTGSPITADMKRAIEESASLFLEKPFDISRVRTFLKQALTSEQGGLKEVFPISCFPLSL